MSSDLIDIINNAARPWKDCDIEVGEKTFRFKTRTLSAIESDKLTQVFSEKFDEVSREMESGNVDIAILKRSLQRQSKEALAKLIVKADRIEFLSEASTELDDLPFTDERVKALANEKQDAAYNLLMGATEDEVLDKALERRAFVAATIKATDAQNLHFLYLSLYNPDETRAFADPEDIGRMDRETIGLFINKIYETLRNKGNTNPLKSRAKKGSAKHTPSQNTSEEE